MAIVVVNDAAQHITSPYRTFVIWRKAEHRSLLSDSLVWSLLIVVGDILGHGPVQMFLIDDDELVQALFSHGSNPAFSKGIGIWRLNRGVDHSDMLRAEDCVKGSSECRITIMDQKTHRHVAFLKIPDDLPGLLNNPGTIWMGGAAGEVDATSADLNEEQHIGCLEEQRFNREEVARQNLVSVVIHQVTPTGGTFPIWRGKNVVPLQDVGNRLFAYAVSELAKFALDLAIAPVSVFLRKPDDEALEFLINVWATVAAFRIVCPFALHQLAVPAKNSFRLEYPDDLTKLLNGMPAR